MRYTFTLALIFLSASLYSQSAFFVGIGLDTGEVKEYLNSRSYVTLLDDQQQDVWIASAFDNQEINYRFHDATLYAIEDVRAIDDKEKALAVSKTCVDYMKLLDFDTKQIESVSNTEHYVAITHDRVVEFIQERNKEDESYRCTLRVTSRRYGPRMKTESFVASINAY